MTARGRRVPAEFLEECYQGLLAGASIKACLECHAEDAAWLGPQLQAIACVRQACAMPARDALIAAYARTQFVSAAVRVASSPLRVGKQVGLWHGLNVAWQNLWQGFTRGLSGLDPIPAGLVLTLTAVFLVGMLTTGTVTASATAIPGQFLYPVKLVAEQTRLRLALDPAIHSVLAAEIDENRRSEARQILARLLRVDHLVFAGVVESMRAGEWTISGLPVEITSESEVDGAAQVGDHVRGEVRAPGDGRLVALKLSVDVPRLAASARPIPATRAVSTPAPPFTPTPSPSPIPPTLAPPLAAPKASPSPDEDELLRKSTATPAKTARPTATRTLTLTPRPTHTPTPSLTPARTVTYGKIIDVVRDITGSRWTIGSFGVETNADTQLIDSPGLGDRVDASVAVIPDRSTLALTIRALREPAVTKLDTTGVVNSMGPTLWDVDGTVFTISGDTHIDSGINLYDYANVQAERHGNGESHALRIIRLVEGTTQFSGPIESMSGGRWVVMGHAVNTDARTVYTGGPAAIGRTADVEALEVSGSLVARMINVHIDMPTAAPTDEPVEEPPTATLEPPPSPTPPKPTRTPTPLPPRDVSALTARADRRRPGVMPIRPWSSCSQGSCPD